MKLIACWMAPAFECHDIGPVGAFCCLGSVARPEAQGHTSQRLCLRVSPARFHRIHQRRRRLCTTYCATCVIQRDSGRIQPRRFYNCQLYWCSNLLSRNLDIYSFRWVGIRQKVHRVWRHWGRVATESWFSDTYQAIGATSLIRISSERLSCSFWCHAHSLLGSMRSGSRGSCWLLAWYVVTLLFSITAGEHATAPSLVAGKSVLENCKLSVLLLFLVVHKPCTTRDNVIVHLSCDGPS